MLLQRVLQGAEVLEVLELEVLEVLSTLQQHLSTLVAPFSTPWHPIS
ncbi:MAG: hypothetical protein M3541_13325 [Acidobacteriota bacterium]|nr:hypothetical protein [Acidobacteriota bacterium]MDQ3419738.1 hypothetical protein [Acidobacteriota bacterium]